MHKSRKFLIMSLGAIVVCGSFIVPSSNGQGQDDLVPLCYRGKTIQVPFYLKPRYLTKGALNGPCPTSP